MHIRLYVGYLVTGLLLSAFVLQSPLVFAFVPNDEFYSLQWGPQRIGAPAAWDITLGVNQTTICIVDTGIFWSHDDLPDFNDPGNETRYLDGYTPGSPGDRPWDDDGHGTRVAGVATALIHNDETGIAGMAQVGLYVVKIDLGAFEEVAVAEAVLGIRWCADQGADVISMSFGFQDPNPTSGSFPELAAAVTYAWNAGSLLVAAAGNDPPPPAPPPQGINFPAWYDEVIAVTCVDQADIICSTSSQGPKAELTAPGEAILTTVLTCDSSGCDYSVTNTYLPDGGTSFSAPHVAGVAALMKSANPSLTNQQMRDCLVETADNLGPQGWDPMYGHGIVNAGEAVRRAATGLYGKVFIAGTGTPVSNAVVSIQGKTYITGAAGAFAFTCLKPGVWLITATHPAYAPYSQYINLILGNNNNLHNIYLQRGGCGWCL